MKIIKEEIFGPVLPLNTFDYLDQDIEYDSDSDLTLSIFTNSLKTIMCACNELKLVKH